MVKTFWNWETLGVIIVLENKGWIGADSQIKKNENTWLKNKYTDYFALIFITWDQAQFERFSYILSNGYRWTRRNVIFKAKRK